jgi:restriction system protein
MAKNKRSEFIKWMGPVLASLGNLGGSGTPTEIMESIIQSQHVPDDKLNERIK